MYVAFLSSFYGFSLFYKINNIHIHFLLVGLRVSFFFSPTVNMVDVFYAPSPLFSFTSPTSTIPLIFFPWVFLVASALPSVPISPVLLPLVCAPCIDMTDSYYPLPCHPPYLSPPAFYFLPPVFMMQLHSQCAALSTTTVHPFH
ncbi:hypothetical protein EDD17DRAFT_626564 [Pisolithus thermaeus]|nr:hypothetical protein EDD17DRAFT_626564 [Pisolithus thermaeus]